LNNPKNRASLIAIAGAYMLYIAYELFTGRNAPGSSMTPTVAILFCVLFVLLGLGVLFYAWRVWKTPPKEEPEEDKDSLK